MKSNCLLESIKAKIRNPKDIKIYKKGSWSCIFEHQWPHFYWYSKTCKKYYSFRQKDILTWFQQLWYDGNITESELK